MNKNLEKIKEIEISIFDTQQEQRAKTRIEASRDLFFQERYKFNIEQRKHSYDAVNDVVVDLDSLKSNPITTEYTEIIKFVLSNGFTLSNFIVFDNDFEIQLINSEENNIFEINKYELVFLYFNICVSKNLIDIKPKEFKIMLDNNTSCKFIEFIDNKFSCKIIGLNINKIVLLDIREIIRLQFLEKEFLKNDRSISRIYRNSSLYKIVFKEYFKFMYTLNELLDEICDFKLPLDINIDNYKVINFKNFNINSNNCESIFNIDKLLDISTLNVSKKEYIELLNNDVNVYEEEIIKKMINNQIGEYLK